MVRAVVNVVGDDDDEDDLLMILLLVTLLLSLLFWWFLDDILFRSSSIHFVTGGWTRPPRTNNVMTFQRYDRSHFGQRKYDDNFQGLKLHFYFLFFIFYFIDVKANNSVSLYSIA